jgi:arsenite methyltransferase
VETDIWAAWLRERRFGGDEENARRMLEVLSRVRDKVLDRAELTPGETLLDVGCGNGLIAFGALERGAAEVVFADVSSALLDECRTLATDARVSDRCRFVVAGAEDLSAMPDASVDVVTTRSVLIYVQDKARAFAEFFRVLRPGGRFSCFEPINRFGCDYRRHDSFWGYPIDGLGELRERIDAVYDAIQPPSDPMLDFDERDLVDLAETAGFFPIELELHLEVEPTRPTPWETWSGTAGNPKIPSLAEAMEQTLTAGERTRVEAHLRPLVEAGAGTMRSAVAYLTARAPESAFPARG